MNTLFEGIKRFVCQEDGAARVEYALLLAFVALVMFTRRPGCRNSHRKDVWRYPSCPDKSRGLSRLAWPSRTRTNAGWAMHPATASHYQTLTQRKRHERVRPPTLARKDVCKTLAGISARLAIVAALRLAISRYGKDRMETAARLPYAVAMAAGVLLVMTGAL